MRPNPKDCVVLPPASMNLRRTAGQLADGESFGIVQLRLNILNTANLSCQWPCDSEKQAFLEQRPCRSNSVVSGPKERARCVPVWRAIREWACQWHRRSPREWQVRSPYAEGRSPPARPTEP